MEGTQRSKFAITTWMIWLGLMGIILLSGLVAGIMVFWKGLGITNLTDMVPWGLWITIDLSSIALGAGAFSMCAAVYLFGLKRWTHCSHGHIHRLDRLYHGNSRPDPGYWAA